MERQAHRIFLKVTQLDQIGLHSLSIIRQGPILLVLLQILLNLHQIIQNQQILKNGLITQTRHTTLSAQ